jgi:hypothetical protein
MGAWVMRTALAVYGALTLWISLAQFGLTGALPPVRVAVLPPVGWLGGFLLTAVVLARISRAAPTQWLPLLVTGVAWLPFIPGQIPPAFAVWQGPLLGVVWLVAGVGLLWPALHGARGPAVFTSRGAVVAGALCAVALSLGWWQVRDRLPAGDEPHYLIIAQSLLNDGDLAIDDNHERREYLPYFRGELKPDYLRRGRDGRIYSIHAPGVSALIAPAYAAAGYAGTVALMILLTSLGAALLWQMLFTLTADAGAAWVATVSVIGSVPVFLHGFTVFPDPAGAVALIAALWLLVALQQGQTPSSRLLLGVGTVLALLPWFHTRFAITAGITGAILAARLWKHPQRWTALTQLLAVPAVSAAAWFLFFQVLYGTPMPTAPYGGYTQSALAHWGPGIPGLLFDQQFGLFTAAPVLLLAVLGIGSLARQSPRLAVEVALLTVPYLLAVAAYRMWWGGYSAPARFLVAVLPALALPMAAWWKAGGTARRVFTLALLLVSLAGLVARLVIDGGALIYNARNGSDLLLGWLNPLVNLTLALPALHRDAPGVALVDIAMWLVVLGACAVIALRLPNGNRMHWLATGAALVTTMTVSTTLVWARHGVVWTPATAATDMLEVFAHGETQRVWTSDAPTRLRRASDLLPTLLLSTSERITASPGATLFSSARVSAGEYRLVSASRTPAAGRLTVTIGRSDAPLLQLDATQLSQGDGLTLTLPQRVNALVITGDDGARQTIARVRITPVRIVEGVVPGAVAVRAARYGAVQAWFLDDHAFVEAPGFWTQGHDTTGLVVEAPDASVAEPVMRLRAGPVTTRVMVTVGATRTALTLEPGQTHDVVLRAGDAAPTERGRWSVRLDTETEFVPALTDAGSKDLRRLGAWIEFPAP